jgi:hypothetical protein
MLIDEDMKTDVELLKRDFDLLAGLAEKFDVAIDKLTGVSTAIDKMLAVHDARLNTTEKQTEVIHQRITDFKTEVLEEIKELRKENNIQHKSVEDRLDKLERWRWVVMGAAAAIGSAVTTLIAFKDLI